MFKKTEHIRKPAFFYSLIGSPTGHRPDKEDDSLHSNYNIPMKIRHLFTRSTGLKALLTLLVVSTLCVGGCSSATAETRNLSDYRNDDGSAPDGKREGGDDTSAFKKALQAGPGVVHVGSGTFRLGDVSIPAGVTVVGQGEATILRSNGAKQIFSQDSVGNWAIRDLVLEGDATGDWHTRTDKGQNGIVAVRCTNYNLSGLTLRNFNGAGLHMSRNIVNEFRHAGNLERIHAVNNHTGIHFDIRAEYANASGLACYNNVQGCVINAGNVKITNSSFVANIDGVVIEDKENGSHGIITDSMLNHNERYSLLARNVAYGMLLSNCAIFTGTLRVENSVGLNVTDGIISSDVEVIGDGANRFSGNYIIQEKYAMKFAPSTIVKDNFSSKGAWEPK